jgi:hypothetical protein
MHNNMVLCLILQESPATLEVSREQTLQESLAIVEGSRETEICFTLEEAMDTILFCSSIARDIA